MLGPWWVPCAPFQRTCLLFDLQPFAGPPSRALLIPGVHSSSLSWWISRPPYFLFVLACGRLGSVIRSPWSFPAFPMTLSPALPPGNHFLTVLQRFNNEFYIAWYNYMWMIATFPLFLFFSWVSVNNCFPLHNVDDMNLCRRSAGVYPLKEATAAFCFSVSFLRYVQSVRCQSRCQSCQSSVPAASGQAVFAVDVREQCGLKNLSREEDLCSQTQVSAANWCLIGGKTLCVSAL